jgi:hypothetical protein
MRKLATLKRLFDHRALYCQLIVTRRCNLACGYCNEFDSVSKPVPYEELVRWMDHLVGELGVTIMDFLGGEPLLHPRIADLVHYAHEKGCWTNIITNGLLLSDEKIEALNRAGLDSMCVSIDRVNPTDFTRDCGRYAASSPGCASGPTSRSSATPCSARRRSTSSRSWSWNSRRSASRSGAACATTRGSWT